MITSLPLETLQRLFAEAVYAEKEEALLPHIKNDGGFSAADRLSVYRNNVFHALSHALETTYPAVRAVIDPEFFRYAAKEYIHTYPSQSGNLDLYGKSFPLFLESFSPVISLPYLPDLARLEWACHESDRAADGTPLNASGMAGLAPDEYASLHLALTPPARLLRMQFPVDALHAFALSALQETPPDITPAPTDLLVCRRGWKAEIHRLLTGEYLFLYRLGQGDPLERAFEAAMSEADDFSFPLALEHGIRRRIFSQKKSL